MKIYYVSYPVGDKPRVVESSIDIVTMANGKRFLKTPFAMLDCGPNDELLDLSSSPGYYATKEEAQVYIDNMYPHRDNPLNEAVMERLYTACLYRHQDRLAHAIGLSTYGPPSIYDVARGKIRATRKMATAAREYAFTNQGQ